MLGIVAADLRMRYVDTRERPWLYAIAGITLAIASREQSQMSGYDHVDYLWYLACFVCVLVAVAGRGDPIVTWKPFIRFGKASFSIYLVHAPFLAWFMRIGVPAAFATCLRLLVGFAFSAVFESRVNQRQQRDRIDALLHRIVPGGKCAPASSTQGTQIASR